MKRYILICTLILVIITLGHFIINFMEENKSLKEGSIILNSLNTPTGEIFQMNLSANVRNVSIFKMQNTSLKINSDVTFWVKNITEPVVKVKMSEDYSNYTFIFDSRYCKKIECANDNVCYKCSQVGGSIK